MRDLMMDEIDAVSGAGFWGDLWSLISGAFTASADFLGFDGRFGTGGGSGGFFRAVGNLFNDLNALITIESLAETCPAGHTCVPFGPEGSPALRDVSDGNIYYTPEYVQGMENVDFDYNAIARDLSMIAAGSVGGAGSGARAAVATIWQSSNELWEASDEAKE